MGREGAPKMEIAGHECNEIRNRQSRRGLFNWEGGKRATQRERARGWLDNTEDV